MCGIIVESSLLERGFHVLAEAKEGRRPGPCFWRRWRQGERFEPTIILGVIVQFVLV
jgi:hypothetical protein